MKTQRLLLTLTVVNLGLLLFLLASRSDPALAENKGVAPPIIRAHAFQLVDEQGRVRASLNVLPATRQPNGDVSAESVLLRLITEQGRPSVKISASEQSSGLSFAGPTGTKDTYLILQSDGRVSSLKLRNEDGQERTIKP